MIKFSGQPIDDKLSSIRQEAEERDAVRKAKEEGLPYVDLQHEPIDKAALELVPEKLAKEAQAVAYAIDKKKNLKVATLTSKTDFFAKLKLHLQEEKIEVDPHIASKASIDYGLKEYRSIRQENIGEIVSEIRLTEGDVQSRVNIKNIDAASEDMQTIGQETPTTEVLVKIVTSALILKASDIHIEPTSKNTLIRYRIDGSLYDVTRIDQSIYNRLTGRLKLLAKLKLNIKDQAQDGRFTIKRPNSPVETRISVVPAEYGESITLRLLDPEAVALNLDNLGFREDDLVIAQAALKEPNGMIITTGPTGSGKTTSLYAFLRSKKSSDIKTITIEDPIEYHIEGIEQTQTDSDKNYTFASGLRSILRQDPDIILIGEVRDKETANTAIEAALTGHLVFTTLHTNSAPGAMPRLIDLGAKSSALITALKLVIGQRLVRKLCESCKKEAPIPADLKEKIALFQGSLPERAKKAAKQIKLYQNVGCNECTGGYSGRIGIFELLSIDEEFEPVLGKDTNEVKIKKLARDKGMVYMQEDGIIKALQGITTLEEVEKQTGAIKWPKGTVQ